MDPLTLMLLGSAISGGINLLGGWLSDKWARERSERAIAAVRGARQPIDYQKAIREAVRASTAQFLSGAGIARQAIGNIGTMSSYGRDVVTARMGSAAAQAAARLGLQGAIAQDQANLGWANLLLRSYGLGEDLYTRFMSAYGGQFAQAGTGIGQAFSSYAQYLLLQQLMGGG